MAQSFEERGREAREAGLEDKLEKTKLMGYRKGERAIKMNGEKSVVRGGEGEEIEREKESDVELLLGSEKCIIIETKRSP